MQTDPTMLAIGFQLTNGKLEEYKSSPVTMTRIYHTATINDCGLRVGHERKNSSPGL